MAAIDLATQDLEAGERGVPEEFSPAPRRLLEEPDEEE